MVINYKEKVYYLLWDMRPPGPLADSKRVTEIPFLAKVDAQTAPETEKRNPFLLVL